ncbi:quercetin dioxygenase-like cupin family protein [Natranaerovirga hydrolytica]|uniref:Quercetin dioxygenase-like cupin family protein n=1 Tax=Natranaerovirga hydrolytica TaxID=680378 RepID=A0A4R1MK01_9FIRM|nr:cupin domain-containing protein [Natranaerovirga hydrolytica]TCK92795.1 quercetin dioxygenase-like cupin family protein [Natranaerovirga hydrolytica]
MIAVGKDTQLEDLGKGVKRKVLSHSGKMMGVEVHFEKGGIGAAHSHPHEQFTYVLEGLIELDYKGDKFTLNKGDTAYIEPNEIHGVKALEDAILLDVFTPQREDFLK